MEKIDIKKVLVMPEGEFEMWLGKYAYDHREETIWYDYLNHKYSLADLAFRLRDAAVKEYSQGWRTGKNKVMNAAPDWGGYSDLGWDEEAQPIHWILVAMEVLKAKEK